MSRSTILYYDSYYLVNSAVSTIVFTLTATTNRNTYPYRTQRKTIQSIVPASIMTYRGPNTQI